MPDWLAEKLVYWQLKRHEVELNFPENGYALRSIFLLDTNFT